MSFLDKTRPVMTSCFIITFFFKKSIFENLLIHKTKFKTSKTLYENQI